MSSSSLTQLIVPSRGKFQKIVLQPDDFVIVTLLAGISPACIYKLPLLILGVAQNSPQLSTLTPVPVSTDSTTLKYQQQPGGDTLSDFVTLVCQEAQNAGAHSTQVGVEFDATFEYKNEVVSWQG